MSAAKSPGAVERAHRLAESRAMSAWGRPAGSDTLGCEGWPGTLPDDEADDADERPRRSLRALALVIVGSWIGVFGALFVAHLLASLP